ncbi:50S ribosomal protein L10 [bacterium BMS3Abin14]|nr:50S ribosomal protein L10 [bacterium BMS3Abin14]
MGRTDRDKQVEELHSLFSEMRMAVLADYRGLTVADLSELRIRLREVQGRFRVVKNTLSIRAADGTPLESVKEHFVGPVGILFTEGDPVGPAKALVHFMKTNENLEIKAGILAGKVLGLSEIRTLADLPDRDTLLATTLATFQAPAEGFVRLLSEIPGSFVRVLDAIRTLKDAA